MSSHRARGLKERGRGGRGRGRGVGRGGDGKGREQERYMMKGERERGKGWELGEGEGESERKSRVAMSQYYLVGLLRQAFTAVGEIEAFKRLISSSVKFPVKTCPKQRLQGRTARKEFTR